MAENRQAILIKKKQRIFHTERQWNVGNCNNSSLTSPPAQLICLFVRISFLFVCDAMHKQAQTKTRLLSHQKKGKMSTKTHDDKEKSMWIFWRFYCSIITVLFVTCSTQKFNFVQFRNYPNNNVCYICACIMRPISRIYVHSQK